MSGYVDTIILEANRQNSQQVGEAQSNAEWTNEVSSGVKLNVGDKISVHSAFVSDLGAEDSTIEFKGAIIQKEQKFQISEITPVPLPNQVFEFSEIFNSSVYRRKYAGETIEVQDKVIQNVKDNQANIVLSYYTSLNGEYVQTLPINYTVGTTDNTAWSVVRGNDSQAKVEATNNGLCLGVEAHKILYNDNIKLGDDFVATQAHQDGSRCMIFGRPKVSYFEIPSDLVLKNTDSGVVLVDTGVPKNRDLFGYQVSLIKIRQLLELEVPLGFNSPSEIGSVITDLLQKNTEIGVDGILFEGDGTNTGFGGQNTRIPYGSSNETSTNKLFNCAAYEDTQQSGAEAFYGKAPASTTAAPQKVGGPVRVYQAGFQYIGIKRPEFYISGLELRDAILPQITPQTNPQLIGPTKNTFIDVMAFFQKTPPGSFTNQLPIFHLPTYPSIDTIRYPNVANISSQKDDTWHRDNLNPLFTNFLEENPFGNWYESTGLASIAIPPTQAIDGYEVEEPVTAGDKEILLKIPFVTVNGKRYYTRPILNNFNLTTEGMTISCPGKPITPVDANITSIEMVEQTIGIPSLRVSFDATTVPAMPIGEPIVINRYDRAYFPPDPSPDNICLPTPYSVLHTSMEFTLDNLKKIFRYFKSQERTPELNTLKGVMTDSFFYSNFNVQEKDSYNGELITPDTHRLFHLQGWKNSQMPKELGLLNTVDSSIPISIFNTTSDAFEGTVPDSDFVSTSFGYDNQPSFFTNSGSLHNTVDTKDRDYSSLPFYVKYFKDIAESRDWENMTQEEFDNEVFQNGEHIKQERCSEETLRESITDGLWGGFAVRTPSSCQFVPKVGASVAYPGKRVFESYAGTINDNMEVIKSYENNKFLREVDLTTNTNADPEWEKTYTKSVYDCISFVCQIPYANAKQSTPEEAAESAYMKLENIYTQVNEFGMYDPTSTPTQRNILTPYKIDWWEDVLSKTVGAYPTPNRIELLTDTKRFGYDTHPTAYGNLFTGLYNGIQGDNGCAPKEEYEVAIDTKFYNNNARSMDAFTRDGDGYANAVPKYVAEFITDVFIGASAPEFAFDTTTSRFSFSGLHTPEQITAKYNATLIMSDIATGAGGALEAGPVPIPDNLGKDCYRINKEMDRRNFCPSITPYYDDIALQIVNTAQKALFPYRNPYIKAGKIIDSHSGIFLDQFGIDEKNWNRSFWGICGFSYNDLNTNDNKGSINERIISGQLNDISLITTNQDVENSSIDEWFGPLTGVANHKPCLPFPVLAKFDPAGGNAQATSKFQFTSPIEVESISAKVEATNLPTKTLRPYFTIRSDIITDDKFHGHDKAVMPVLEVLQKQGQYGDFFYGEGTTEFTNTFPRTITSIKTQICDPSGKLASISANSAVMYKIKKQNNASLNVAEEVLQNLQPKKK